MTAFVTACSEALTMLVCTPTPQTGSSLTSASMYATAVASAAAIVAMSKSTAQTEHLKEMLVGRAAQLAAMPPIKRRPKKTAKKKTAKKKPAKKKKR